jgi:hypothetical protein
MRYVEIKGYEVISLEDAMEILRHAGNSLVEELFDCYRYMSHGAIAYIDLEDASLGAIPDLPQSGYELSDTQVKIAEIEEFDLSEEEEKTIDKNDDETIREAYLTTLFEEIEFDFSEVEEFYKEV